MIQENIEKLYDKLEELKDHPMCLELREDDYCYIVIFPQGDFSVDGITCSKSIGKSNAIDKIIKRMEKEWINSYPNPK